LAISTIISVPQIVAFIWCAIKARTTGGGDAATAIVSGVLLVTAFLGMVISGAGLQNYLITSLFSTGYGMGFGSWAIIMTAGLLALSIVLMIKKPAVTGGIQAKAGVSAHAYAVPGPAIRAGAQVIMVPSNGPPVAAPAVTAVAASGAAAAPVAPSPVPLAAAAAAV
jgi:hypothetical protein